MGAQRSDSIEDGGCAEVTMSANGSLEIITESETSILHSADASQRHGNVESPSKAPLELSLVQHSPEVALLVQQSMQALANMAYQAKSELDLQVVLKDVVNDAMAKTGLLGRLSGEKERLVAEDVQDTILKDKSGWRNIWEPDRYSDIDLANASAAPKQTDSLFLAQEKGVEKGEFQLAAQGKQNTGPGEQGGQEIVISTEHVGPEADHPNLSPVFEGEEKTTPFQSNVFEAAGNSANSLIDGMNMLQSYSLEDSLEELSYYSEHDSIGMATVDSATMQLLHLHLQHNQKQVGPSLSLTNKFRPIKGQRSALKTALPAPTGSCSCLITEDGGGGKKNTSKIKRKLSWYDDEGNWHKPFTLKSDESFDEYTIESSYYTTTPSGGAGMAGQKIEELVSPIAASVEVFFKKVTCGS